jgi:mannobiose 2-epimerase
MQNDLQNELTGLAARVEKDLLENLLPFWLQHAPREKGGFLGLMSEELLRDSQAPRSAVMVARILWTFSAAYRLYAQPEYLQMAQIALKDLRKSFWDPIYRGIYWLVGSDDRVVMDRKHSYAQGFAIYGLSEYCRATGDHSALELAIALFDLLENYAHDDLFGGYIEGCARDWSALADMRLSDKEPVCQKSMNTLLHIIEPYTNLLRVWRNERIEKRVRELILIFLERVIDKRNNHFCLFFDQNWQHRQDEISFGHDIEGSWLLVEAAEVLGDTALLKQVEQTALQMAEAVLNEALAPDGSLYYERHRDGSLNKERHWWVQAEGMVGFYNAYQLSGDARYVSAMQEVWNFIDAYMVDHENGEWHKVLDANLRPCANVPKIGPWECPYHHSRAAFELVERIGKCGKVHPD